MMTREELKNLCRGAFSMAKGGSPNEAGDQLADLLWELTGKTPETPKRTRGMEIAEKVVLPSVRHPKSINFRPSGNEFSIDLICPESSTADTIDTIRQYIADAIDAAEPQCKLPVIEWKEESEIRRYYLGDRFFPRADAEAVAKACGYQSLSDYPNLKERK